jgi:cystathionine beta-lyase/cystathionine gamma-synthase
MSRNAMMAMKNHAKNVCTIHRWRVARRTVAEIHHPKMHQEKPPQLAITSEH